MGDLRDFLERIRTERKIEWVEIDREVDPRHETAAILVKLEEKQRSPVLFFKNVRGTRFPLVTNVAGSMGRLALALGCPLREVTTRYGEGVRNPVKPLEVDSAPVHQNVRTRGDVDLGLLPALVYHEADAEEPYITAGIVSARDPDTGLTNLSYHRLMIAGRDRTGIFIERDVIGGLERAPLELTRCRTQPTIHVPARAELVLEGFVPPDEEMDEGPFGEFTGHGTGRTRTPVFHVTAMTMRDDMIFQDIVSGRMEHLILSMPAIEHRTDAEARAASPNVVKVTLAAPFTSIVALDKQDDDEPRRIIERILGGDIYAKHVIVVDADVDTASLNGVLTAAALNVQADRDVHVFTGRQGTPLDPSCPSEDGKIAKMGIDATRPISPKRPVTKNKIPAHVLDRIDLAELLKKKT
jgi:2,5-furandicarboxylate decarboxylase 1